MKPEYKAPQFEILELMPKSDIKDLSASSGELGDIGGGGNEDFNV